MTTMVGFSFFLSYCVRRSKGGSSAVSAGIHLTPGNPRMDLILWKEETHRYSSHKIERNQTKKEIKYTLEVKIYGSLPELSQQLAEEGVRRR